ncbi:unnamed protein product [Adineta steineri]|uniref:Uncharacterized protein n=1 Tax=Adineta steineri TaxID=433720 RepID=A0A815ZG33_9BILA|nr:unnamed protein product [Adineta steineri]CAF1582815.1 unnamed protein product [Adineta steineri]
MFVDKDHSVYVADTFNNRVMKWMKDANEGILIAPGQVSNKNPDTLLQPAGVIVDHIGNIYVSNGESHQITRWSPGELEGTSVVGEKQRGSGPTQLTHPYDLSFDKQGNLYVVDRGNHRIQNGYVHRGRYDELINKDPIHKLKKPYITEYGGKIKYSYKQ